MAQARPGAPPAGRAVVSYDAHGPRRLLVLRRGLAERHGERRGTTVAEPNRRTERRHPRAVGPPADFTHQRHDRRSERRGGGGGGRGAGRSVAAAEQCGAGGGALQRRAQAEALAA